MLTKKIPRLLIMFVIVIIVAMLYASCVKADQTTVIPDRVATFDPAVITLTEVCLNGRMYLVSAFNLSVSTIQVMRAATNYRMKLTPVLCTAIQGSSTNFITQGQE